MMVVRSDAAAVYAEVALEVLQTQLRAGQRVHLSVTGWSMAPLLRPNDLIVVEAVGAEGLRRGDIVTVRHSAGLVTHRLVAVDQLGWHTKGDNARSNDPPVAAAAILGRVVALEHDGLYIDLRAPSWIIYNQMLGVIGAAERSMLLAAHALHYRLGGGAADRRSKRWVHAIGMPFGILGRVLVLLALYRRSKRGVQPTQCRSASHSAARDHQPNDAGGGGPSVAPPS